MASKKSGNSKRSSKNRIVVKDLTEGKELNFPIPVINNYNNEIPTFDYVAHNSFTTGVEFESKTDEGEVIPPQGCGCEFDHITQSICGKDCQCENVSLVGFDPKNRIVVDPMSIDFYQEFYVECGMHCGCQGKCRRRIFPGSHAAKKLHVEYFLNKGFGVVVDQPVAAGMPVCEYRGLVCIRETDLIQPSHYQQDLLYDNDGNFYVVDAVNDGSVARFINHSCSANLVQINVYSSIPSQKKIPPPPRVALVACRDILAGTELTFNYGVAYFHDRHLRCFCYELCCLIPADDWALKTKNERETTQEINFAKRHIETHFDETKDVEPECIDLSD